MMRLLINGVQLTIVRLRVTSYTLPRNDHQQLVIDIATPVCLEGRLWVTGG